MSVTRSNLQALAHERLREAEALFDAGLYSGAYYLAGYVIEFALKAVIAKNFKSETIPDKGFVDKIYKHKPSELIGLSSLQTELSQKLLTSTAFSANWGIIGLWTSEKRYTNHSRDAAESLIKAISDTNDGVLPWISSHW